MNLKWFLIGIPVGFLIAFIIGTIWGITDPYTSIEQVCYDSSYTAEEYEECVNLIIDNWNE